MKKQINIIILIVLIGTIINIVFLFFYYIKTTEKINDQKIFISELTNFMDTVVSRQFKLYDKLPYGSNYEDSILKIGNDLIHNFNIEKFNQFYDEYGNKDYLPKISEYTNFDIYIRMIQLSYFESNIERVFQPFAFNAVGLRTTIEKIKKNKEIEIPIFLTYSMSKNGKFYSPQLLIDGDTLKLYNDTYFKYKFKPTEQGKHYIDFELLNPTNDKYQSFATKLSIEVLD
jgi:hypothetical protein